MTSPNGAVLAPPAALRAVDRKVVAGPGADRDGRLTPETVAALAEAGFARHFVPRRWGGAAGSFGELVPAVAAVAEQCASAAWCAALWAWHARFAALLPAAGQAQLWSASPDVLVAAALMPPAGRAEPVPGGFRLSGRWDCVSGVEHSQWILLSTPGPAGAPLVLAVARAQVTVERTWQAAGLRASGGDTVVVEDVTVPAHSTMDATRMLGGDDNPGAARCHAAPAHLAGGLVLAAVGLGSARAALAAWQAALPGGDATSPAAATTLGRCAAELHAAELVLGAAARRADQGPITALTVAQNRRDGAFAADLAVTAVERLFRAGGAHTRNAGAAVNRAWRDVHTVAAHGALRFDAAAQAYATARSERRSHRDG